MRQLKVMIMVCILSLAFATPCFAQVAKTGDAGKTVPAVKNEITVTGVVKYIKIYEKAITPDTKVEQESISRVLNGYYTVAGYRLSGNQNFGQYLDKNVKVTGYINTIILDRSIDVIGYGQKVLFVTKIELVGTGDTKPTAITVTGAVKYVNLEGGFYAVQGYRLIGSQNFKEYLEKNVKVTGTLFDGISIQMVKGINVEKIEVLDNGTEKPKPITLIGIVKQEGAEYTLEGYKLIGSNWNFAQYVDKKVMVTGTLDESATIKEVKVQGILLLIHERQLIITGEVKYNETEGVYTIYSYKLVGTEDFKQYLGSKVRATGIVDISPSKEKLRPFKVSKIEVIVDKKNQDISKEIEKARVELNKLKVNVSKFIKVNKIDKTEIDSLYEKIQKFNIELEQLNEEFESSTSKK